jgi:hypothetical protein
VGDIFAIFPSESIILEISSILLVFSLLLGSNHKDICGYKAASFLILSKLVLLNWKALMGPRIKLQSMMMVF